MIKKSKVSFARLRRFLTHLGFEEVDDNRYWRFERADSGTVFVFRPYRPRDMVHVPDTYVVKSQLDWRGLVSADSFDDSLEKSPA